jgi:signal transduction histidine kinase
MNPLPRILGMALFVVLAALAALLAMPAWRPPHPEPTAVRSSSASQPASVDDRTPAADGPAPRASRIALQTQRLILALAMVGLGLAGALLFSLAFRSTQTDDPKAPFHAARTEMGTLAKLAETSVAQGTELNRERDVRRRAEEDVQLKQRLLTQSLEEQVRLGRDLHDGIIQSLYAVGLTLESVRPLLRDDPGEADRRLEQCRAALNSSIREARTYISGLAPHHLRHAGFSRALDALLADLRGGRAASFEIEVDDDATALLTPEQTIEALQIAREAVSNALRHGGASTIKLRVHKGDREICLLVQDNGTGFDASTRRAGGHGLSNMRARAASVGATLRLTSRPGEGTRVLTTLPILLPAVA